MSPHAYPPSESEAPFGGLPSADEPDAAAPSSSINGGATLLGWHAEGPFLQPAKKGAHAQSFLVSAPDRIASFEDVYGVENLKPQQQDENGPLAGVRVITAAPEVEGVMDSIDALAQRGVIFSVGHRCAINSVAVPVT